MSQIEQALRWVDNAKEGATVPNLMEDFEPIGALLWDDLQRLGLAEKDADGRLHLTLAGRKRIGDLP